MTTSVRPYPSQISGTRAGAAQTKINPVRAAGAVEPGQFAEFLHEKGIIRYGQFELSSGRKSPYYADLRMAPSYPVQFRRMVKAVQSLVSDRVGLDSFGQFASVPTGGLVIAAALAMETVKPLVYVRSSPKPHGTSKSVEGAVSEGDAVVVVDDVATTGGSVMRAVAELRGKGAVVKDAFVALDRLEGAGEALAGRGVRLHALADIAAVTRELRKSGRISDGEAKAILG